MTIDSDGSLPRWGGITEPTTVLTNAVLAAVGFVFGTRLAYDAAGAAIASAGGIAFGLVMTSFAAAVGAVAHGIDPLVAREQRDRCWRGALFLTGFAAAGAIASVAFFAATGIARKALLILAGLNLLSFLVRAVRQPQFRVATLHYMAGLVVVLLGAIYTYVRWRTPASPWLIGAVVVSAGAGLVQARRMGLHRHLNHNDLYHLIQVVALYLFYRGGVLLVDR